jgi:hypothetical protein
MYLLNYIKKCINLNKFQILYCNHKLQKFLKLIYILTHKNEFIWYGVDAFNVYACTHAWMHVSMCKNNILQGQVI